MHIIKESSKLPTQWALFDGENFIAEHLSQIQLEQKVIEITIEKLRDYLMDFKPSMSYFEAELIAGRVLCCDCKHSITVSDYNPDWKLTNQRCEACR